MGEERRGGMKGGKTWVKDKERNKRRIWKRGHTEDLHVKKSREERKERGRDGRKDGGKKDVMERIKRRKAGKKGNT